MVFFKNDSDSRQHVSKLYGYIDTHHGFFKRGYMSKGSNLKDFKEFVDKWNRDALDLGWSIQLVYAVSATGEKVNNKFLKALLSVKLPKQSKDNDSCTCSTQSDWCDILENYKALLRAKHGRVVKQQVKKMEDVALSFNFPVMEYVQV